MSQDVVDFPGDPVALVQGRSPALLLAELLGLGQQDVRLLGLDTVAAQQAAEDEAEEQDDREAEPVPGAHGEHQRDRHDRDHPERGDSACGSQAKAFPAHTRAMELKRMKGPPLL